MNYKRIILSHVLEYLKLKKYKYKKTGKLIMLECPFCNGMTAQVIADTHKIECLKCDKRFTLVSVVRKIEKDKSDKEKYPKEKVIQYLKELLNIKTLTPQDEEKVEKALNRYVKYGWSLVPLARFNTPKPGGGFYSGKEPIEKEWQKKEHRDKKEWVRWLVKNKLNIGVRTGVVSDIIVIDVDTKPLPKVIKKYMGKALIQETRKGFHLFYKYDKEFPKTSFELKSGAHIDIETDGGQVVIYPSKADNYKRKFINDNPISEISEDFKKFLMKKITVPRRTYSEKLAEEIENDSYRKTLIEENEGRNDLFMHLAGKYRRFLNYNQTRNVLRILDKIICKPALGIELDRTVLKSVDKYIQFDEQELAHQILEFLKIGLENEEGKTKQDIERAIVGESAKGENKTRLEKALAYLIKEEYIKRCGYYYFPVEKVEWETQLIGVSKPIDETYENFKLPYFHDLCKFNWGDVIVIGAKPGVGKTHISLNIAKQIIDQGISSVYYFSRETGSRFTDIALELGIQEGAIKYKRTKDPTRYPFEKNSITIIDWLLPKEYAKTDQIFDNICDKAEKAQALIIVFVQTRKSNGDFYAKDQIEFFPALTSKYIYEDEDDGTYGYFEIHKIRDRIYKKRRKTIPCKFNWDTKELLRKDEIEEKKPEKEESEEENG